MNGVVSNTSTQVRWTDVLPCQSTGQIHHSNGPFHKPIEQLLAYSVDQLRFLISLPVLNVFLFFLFFKFLTQKQPRQVICILLDKNTFHSFIANSCPISHATPLFKTSRTLRIIPFLFIPL